MKELKIVSLFSLAKKGLNLFKIFNCMLTCFSYIHSKYKKKRKLLNDIPLGVKIIDYKHDSISVALPFNKELNSKVLS